MSSQAFGTATHELPSVNTWRRNSTWKRTTFRGIGEALGRLYILQHVFALWGGPRQHPHLPAPTHTPKTCVRGRDFALEPHVFGFLVEKAFLHFSWVGRLTSVRPATILSGLFSVDLLSSKIIPSLSICHYSIYNLSCISSHYPWNLYMFGGRLCLGLKVSVYWTHPRTCYSHEPPLRCM